ncbi:MAG: DUF5915 domain-containing protein, partial [Chloroflexota bacterium]
TRPLEAFVNDLSKWYLRRSRRRFWKSDSDADKEAAYATLYEALVTIAKLLAPTMPFLADELYQNLARSFDEQAVESVHMADWPKFDAVAIDDDVNHEMGIVMRLASLGHATRNKAAIKVRQPLANVAFSVGSAQEAAAIPKYAELLQDELNVKGVSALGSAGEAVSYSLNPQPKQLGSKYKDKYPMVRQEIMKLNANVAAAKLLAEKSVQIEMNGETLDILPDEVEVRADAKSGLTVASDGAYLAALSTELTDDLVKEGLSREFVRHVQDLRKQFDFNIADRINLYYQASDKLSAAIEQYQDYIMGEVLAVSIENIEPPKEAHSPDHIVAFDGETVNVGLVVNNK